MAAEQLKSKNIGCIGRDVPVRIKYINGEEGKGRVAALNPKETGIKNGLFFAGKYTIESAGIDLLDKVVTERGKKDVTGLIRRDVVYDLDSRSVIMRDVRGGKVEKVHYDVKVREPRKIRLLNWVKDENIAGESL